MTLERAAKILNNHRYQLDSDSRFFWVVDSVSKSVFRMINNSSGYVVELDAFEAIAIAEKLERDSRGKVVVGPEPVYEMNSPEVLAAHACDKALRGLDIHQQRNVMAFLNSIPFDPKAV